MHGQPNIKRTSYVYLKPFFSVFGLHVQHFRIWRFRSLVDIETWKLVHGAESFFEKVFRKVTLVLWNPNVYYNSPTVSLLFHRTYFRLSVHFTVLMAFPKISKFEIVCNISYGLYFFTGRCFWPLAPRLSCRIALFRLCAVHVQCIRNNPPSLAPAPTICILRTSHTVATESVLILETEKQKKQFYFV
jgi:hypothetical protein